ncbi:MAG: hypothetical protein KDA32_10415 [Phycisphaerales bacterium]|nr:hypothetical protein [Phycisphaerales bacterium]
MTETSYARSRQVALGGLLLQVFATAALFILYRYTRIDSVHQFAWMALVCVPIWFASLLVLRQHELAELEAYDLDELRREKQTTGGGSAMFEEGGGGLSYRIAQQRLEWMERWFTPVLALITAAAMLGVGLWRFFVLPAWEDAEKWGAINSENFAVIVLVALMLAMFFLSRYASGMARVERWQILRSGASNMLGLAVVALAAVVSLGVVIYRRDASWEHAIAYAIPVIMIVLGAETLLNFVLDIYRPRSPGAVARPAFDSRLLGLISEPGGIAHTLAEAINYQFGFQVSQTWFYQLLQRAFIPLFWAGAAALWLLSGVVIVHPYEVAVIERWGRQTNADSPYEPGIHFKAPWPIETARKYNTSELHQIVVGLATDADLEVTQNDQVELWTDDKHAGQSHYNFIVHPTPRTVVSADATDRAAIEIVRMRVVVQYRIRKDALADYSRNLEDPVLALRRIAWEETQRFNAASTLDLLLGQRHEIAGGILKDRIAKQAAAMKLGLEIVYVGMLGVHPEKSVAEAYRRVVTAQQEKIKAIREARVLENQVLSRSIGAASLAREMTYAYQQFGKAATAYETGLDALGDQGRTPDADDERFANLRGAQSAYLDLVFAQAMADLSLKNLRDDMDRGLGGSLTDISVAEESVVAARGETEAAKRGYDKARADLESEIGADETAVVDAMLARAYWTAALDKRVNRLGGDAGTIIARAQASRWDKEMQAQSYVTRVGREYAAYAAAPQVFIARRSLSAWVEGLQGARKYVLAFDDPGQSVKVRLETQEQVRPEDAELSLIGSTKE